MKGKVIYSEGGGSVTISGPTFRGDIELDDTSFRVGVYDGSGYASIPLTRDRLDKLIDALLEVQAFLGPPEKEDGSA